MGMFNVIKWNCPNCQNENQTQTKSGSCNMEEFDLNNAPLRDLAEISTEKNIFRIFPRISDPFFLQPAKHNRHKNSERIDFSLAYFFRNSGYISPFFLAFWKRKQRFMVIG